MTEAQNEILSLVDEDGAEHDFEVLDIIEVDEEKYAILLPLNEEYADGNEAVIMKIGEDENGEEILSDIESDEEWEKIADAYDEMIGEDDEEDLN